MIVFIISQPHSEMISKSTVIVVVVVFVIIIIIVVTDIAVAAWESDKLEIIVMAIWGGKFMKKRKANLLCYPTYLWYIYIYMITPDIYL